MASIKLLALVGLFLALLAVSAFAVDCATDFSACNSGAYQGTCYADFPASQSYCACRSGYSGADCASAAPGGCSASFGNLNATKTEYPPIAVNVFFDANVFNVAISSPLVNQRNYTIVAIDNSSFANENCTYPGAYWSRSFDSCSDIFTGAMPWADNVACGWAQNQADASLAVYSVLLARSLSSAPLSSRSSSTSS